MIDFIRLNKVLDYDPNTGIVTWAKRMNNAVSVGQEAGSDHGKGYRFIRYQKKFYFTHRVAWLLFYKDWPDGEIDHINGDRKDNRISNLRVATRSQQMTNTASYKDSTSKYKGVSKVGKKWRAQIAIDGAKHHLGMFDCEKEAALKYNYIALDAWGEYARLNDVF